MQFIILLFGLEQKYFRTPSVLFSPYSTLNCSSNWKLIDFVIHAKNKKILEKKKRIKSKILVKDFMNETPKFLQIFFLRVNVVIVVHSSSSWIIEIFSDLKGEYVNILSLNDPPHPVCAELCKISFIVYTSLFIQF